MVKTLLGVIASSVLMAALPVVAAEAGMFAVVDLPEFRVVNVTLPEALEHLWKEAKKVTKVQGPELRILRHDQSVSTRDYPFREKEMRVTMTLTKVSVYDCLRHLGGLFGFTVNLQYDEVVVAESATLVELPQGSSRGTLSVEEFREVRLPEFKADGLTLAQGLDLLREKTLAVTGREPPVFAMVHYTGKPILAANVILDLRDVPAMTCLSYVTELCGYGYRTRVDRVEAYGLFTLHHPKNTCLYRLSDFARAMRRPEAEVTTETVLEWFAQEPKVNGLPSVSRNSGLVVVGWLPPAAEAVLSRRLGVERLE